MKVAYCSLLLPEEKKLSERTTERLSGISLHKFTSAIINGIESNSPNIMTVFNIINTVNYPKFPQLIFPTENWSHNQRAKDWHIGYINLFGLKYITQTNNLFYRLDEWCKNQGEEQCVICVHHIYYPAMFAACKIKKKYGNKVILCLITGDMNGKYGLAGQYKVNLKQRMIYSLNRKIDKMAKQFDCFVFVTKYMAEAFGVSDKPYTVLECAYTKPPYKVSSDIVEDEEHKTVFYAGAIREEYGIPHLLRAFSMIDDPTYRLQLAGDGNAAELVREYAKEDPRIEFLGFITPKQVDQYQHQATVLINSRKAEEYEFVKYSFAGKTMESLMSGKPYIAHKLPCDPPEYAKYIQYAEDDSDEALRDKIVEICSLSKEKREEIGKKAQSFVINEKNPIIMTKRIINMWNEMGETREKN